MLALLDGGLSNSNIAAGAGIAGAKLADEVLKLAVGGTLRKIGFGVTSVTIASQGGYQTITHSLGTTPQVVVAILSGDVFQINVTTDTYGATTFRLGAYRVDGPNVGTQNVAWIAIG